VKATLSNRAPRSQGVFDQGTPSRNTGCASPMHARAEPFDQWVLSADYFFNSMGKQIANSKAKRDTVYYLLMTAREGASQE